jgi:hypothetical protein
VTVKYRVNRTVGIAHDNPSSPDNNSFLGNAHPTTMLGLFKRTYLLEVKGLVLIFPNILDAI